MSPVSSFLGGVCLPYQGTQRGVALDALGIFLPPASSVVTIPAGASPQRPGDSRRHCIRIL